MTTAFAVLFDLAVEIQSDPRYAKLTSHHDSDRNAVRTRMKWAILQSVMPGEAALIRWQRLRIFCLNYINRAQPAVHLDAVKRMLTTIENAYSGEVERIEALANLQANQLGGSRPEEFIRALKLLTAKDPYPALGNLNYLDWLDERWLYWLGQRVEDLEENALLQDIDVLSKNPETKIPGMGLALAANLMADTGLSAFAKPDLHVLPVVRLLRFSVENRDEERHAFKGLIRISKIEHQILSREPDFAWLSDAGGLWPRFLDRLIYLIGSDNFNLDGVKQKIGAPKRRSLMRQALFETGLLDGRYGEF